MSKQLKNCGNAMCELTTSCKRYSKNENNIINPVERKGKVDFLAKWVRLDFPTGIYCIHVEDHKLVWNASLNWL